MFSTIFYGWFGWNQAIFAAVNGFHGPLLDPLMVLATRLGAFGNAPWIMAAMLCLLAVPPVAARPAVFSWLPAPATVLRTLVIFVFACGLSVVLVSLMKIGFDLPRPSAVLPAGSVRVLVEPESPHSFPSGHSAFAMLVLSVFWRPSGYGWRAVLVLFAALVGISRVSVGAHFPADVLFGYLCGGTCGWIATSVFSLPRRAASPVVPPSPTDGEQESLPPGTA